MPLAVSFDSDAVGTMTDAAVAEVPVVAALAVVVAVATVTEIQLSQVCRPVTSF